MIDSNLEYELVKLKLQAAEAGRLQKRRGELIEVFNKLNLEIPEKVKSHLISTTNLSNEQLKEKLIILTDENMSLLTDLYLFNKMEDIGDMIKKQNLTLKEDIEYINDFIDSNPDDGSILQNYLITLSQRLINLDKEKSEIQDEVIMKDCRIDILTCKLSHLALQLQEPIQELRLKLENNIPITDEEYLLLRVVQKSISNRKLKARIDELKVTNNNLHKQMLQMQDELLQKIQDISKRHQKTVPIVHEHIGPKDMDVDIDTTTLPTVASSYSLDIYKTDSDIKPLAVAILGFHVSQLCKTHQRLEELRKKV